MQNGADYFWGVKKSSIFLIADDGDGEGRRFFVFDVQTLRRTFEDALRFDTEPKFSRTAHGLPSMRYQRIFFAECSLMRNDKDCWAHVEQQVGLPEGPMPKCLGYHGRDRDGIDDSDDPSLIAFPVEVVLEPQIYRKILPGLVHCFAAQ